MSTAVGRPGPAIGRRPFFLSSPAVNQTRLTLAATPAANALSHVSCLISSGRICWSHNKRRLTAERASSGSRYSMHSLADLSRRSTPPYHVVIPCLQCRGRCATQHAARSTQHAAGCIRILPISLQPPPPFLVLYMADSLCFASECVVLRFDETDTKSTPPWSSHCPGARHTPHRTPCLASETQQ